MNSKELVDALRPFADLIENPQDCAADEVVDGIPMFYALVSIDDVKRAQEVVARAETTKQ